MNYPIDKDYTINDDHELYNRNESRIIQSRQRS